MQVRAGNQDFASQAQTGSAVVWMFLAVLAMLSVFLINGRPLFYFDTMGYISQGHSALRQLGWKAESPLEGRPVEVFEESKDSSSPALTKIQADNTVDGSRSTIYAILAGALARLGVLEGLIALNVVAVITALWVPMRVAARHWTSGFTVGQTIAVPLLAASLGSLPFYVAYLMPDTFAPVLLIVMATFAVFARQMTVWEILLCLALGALAIMSHLSHLAIGVLMVPVVALVSVLLARRRWWLAPALALVIVGIGFSEQSVLRSAAKAVSDSIVVVKPYITARLIQDGPGMRYLQTHCPDEEIPTCRLYTALMLSDDPYRLTASHIVFETSQNLGSFRLMTPEDQKIVANNQIGFFFDVLLDNPAGTLLALIKNTFTQAGWVSVDMTLQTDRIVTLHAGIAGLITGEFLHGRITDATSWLGPLTVMQQALYLCSLVIILVLLVMPRRVPPEIKGLAVVLVLGILANALVCGGISQPATRYGARVIWLLPLAATIMLVFRKSQARRALNTGGR
ncbi:MAG: hypothetical protein KDE08_08200 [Rhodobacteraceae bacterium]|nr:hypothetical protein [Paracoccaceae bacterium]